MYWLQRPPYLRRFAAVALVLTAVWWDLRSQATEPLPVAAHQILRGTAVESSDVEWVEVPRGRLPIPDLTQAVAATDIGAGEPLTASMFAPRVPIPADWWTVPIEVGTLALPGDEILLVVADPPLTTYGIVVAAQTGDRYSLDFRPAAVAVPPSSAPLVAAAAREGLLVTAARTGG